MTAKWKILSVSVMAAMMLAACNTSGDSNAGEGADAPDTGQTDQTETTEDTGTDTDTDSSESEEAEEDAGTEDQQEADADEERGPDRELTFKKDGGEETGKAVLTESDEQDYSIYVLDGYELTSEEPGRDSLYHSEDSKNFMRIEVFNEDETDYTETVVGMENLLATTEDEPQDALGKYNLADDSTVEELVVKEAKSDEVLMTGAVFVTSGKIVRLTVFDQPDGALTDAFLKMGATVGPK